MRVSTYFGSSSIRRASRLAFSHAIRVDPEPPHGSSAMCEEPPDVGWRQASVD
jgi:hypothetical protein